MLVHTRKLQFVYFQETLACAVDCLMLQSFYLIICSIVQAIYLCVTYVLTLCTFVFVQPFVLCPTGQAIIIIIIILLLHGEVRGNIRMRTPSITLHTYCTAMHDLHSDFYYTLSLQILIFTSIVGLIFLVVVSLLKNLGYLHQVKLKWLQLANCIPASCAENCITIHDE